MNDTMLEGIHLLTPSSHSLSTIVESIVMIHASCILNDNTMATFMPPLSHGEMTKNWKSLIEAARDDHRLIFIYVSKINSRSSAPKIHSPFSGHDWPVLPSKDDEDHFEVSGVVSLSNPESQTGPFRGVVQRLLVSPFHRRKGIATDLMAELEKRALAMGRWSLMLDTTVGTPAEHVYPVLGYEKLGVVREYGFSPKDGSLLDEVFFWKDLRKNSSTD